MKILQISSHYSKGGAAIAAKRLHLGLREIGVKSTFYAYYKSIYENKADNYHFILSDKVKSAKVIFETKLFNWINGGSKNEYIFSAPLLFQFPGILNYFSNYDVLNFHWINSGFININTLSKLKGKKIFWTLHDMWPFTGGCHYSQDCIKYKKSCNNCIALKDGSKIAEKNFMIRKLLFKNIDVQFITPSKWLYECAKESNILKDQKIHYIAYGIDTRIFKPLDKNKIREELNINQNIFTVIFTSANLNDSRKGIKYLISSLEYLKNKIDCQIILLGNFDDDLRKKFKNIKTYFVGNVNDEMLIAKYYNAADIFVIPSLEDNLPNTLLESLSCGIPIIGFNIGGVPDVVIEGKTGKIVYNFSIEELTEKIKYFYELGDLEMKQYQQNARNLALEKYDFTIQAQNYLNIYNQI